MKDYQKFIETVRGYLNGNASKEQVWYELGRIDAASEPITEPVNQPRYADWSQAPEWAKWHGIDEDGMSVFYADKPRCIERQWLGNWCDHLDKNGVLHNKHFDMEGIDWTKTLEARP